MDIQSWLSFVVVLVLLIALFILMKQLIHIVKSESLDKKKLAFIMLFLFQPIVIGIGMFLIQGFLSTKPLVQITIDYFGITLIYCLIVGIWWSMYRRKFS
jgi:hypothetical protein